MPEGLCLQWGLWTPHSLGRVQRLLPPQPSLQCLASSRWLDELWLSGTLISILEKRSEKFFMGKTTAWYSMVELSKMLSLGNDESSSTKTVRRIESVTQEAPVVQWQVSELCDQTDFASNRAFLHVTWGTSFWVSLNLGFIILKT